MVFHYEIKLSKRLKRQYNHLKLNTPCSSSTRTNTNSYELAARQLKAQKYKRYGDFVMKFPYRFFLCFQLLYLSPFIMSFLIFSRHVIVLRELLSNSRLSCLSYLS